ncbi:MAG: tetratricopeptide repeat protein [Bacteroidia bacterium]|nr:tetratricopeptide repeat protein [Bacteroidia bacterium]MDW8134380.1 tetratricopeptide repeat protein [Bacteroidia bacterium]
MWRLGLVGAFLWAQSLSEAEQALSREDYARALTITQQILSAKPKELYAYYLQGQALLGQYRQADEEDTRRPFLLKQAREAFSAALAKNPKYALAHVGIAEVDVMEKNTEAAKSALAKAEEYGASEVKVLIEAARVYTLLGGKLGRDKAINFLSKAKIKDSTNAAILRGLGDLWLQEGVVELAIDNYQKATLVEPKNPENFYKLGIAYKKAKSYREAGEAFKKAIDNDASFAPAYRELGEIYYIVQKYPQAKENYQKYVLLRPELSARARYATFLYLSKDYKTAIQEIRTVLKDTFSLILQRLLGYSLIEDGQYEEGLREMDTYFQKQRPEKVIGKDYMLYGKGLDKTNRDSLAIIYYRNAIQKDSSLGQEIYPDLAGALNALGRYKEAAEVWEKAIAKNPSLTYHYSLGRVYYKLGQTEKDTSYYYKAIQAFRYIQEKKPDLVSVYTELGRCYAMLDPESTEGRAKPYYEKVVELGSGDPSKYKSDLIEAHSYLGYYYYNKQDYQKSYENYSKLKELDPQNPQAAQALPYLESMLKKK